jgi:hypothetical protein
VSDAPSPAIDYARRHLRTGWWALLIFATIGFILESLHGFKVRAYLDVSNETRRLMWTLAHAHGTALGVLNVLFGLTVRTSPDLLPGRLGFTSKVLLAATVVLPAGFFLGGFGIFGGDPGLGVLVVPIGAALLIYSLFEVARGVGNADAESHRSTPADGRRGKR